MILHPRFYEAPVTDRIAEREKLGLRRELPTGLVLFGGHGSQAMLEIAQRLDASSLNLQLIFTLRTEREAREIHCGAQKARLPRFVEGFTTKK